MRGEYLPGGVFALFHGAEQKVRAGTAVVLVPPFGSEEVASYRERRWLADRLATAGYPTLRLDLPGTGDSAGNAADPQLLDAWGVAISTAVQRMEVDGERVAVVACGLGGVPAVLASAAGMAADLVLWATPSDGRTAVRRLRTLARLQPNRIVAMSPLPEGALEVGGYVLSEATLASLATVDLASAPPTAARALLLSRDGTPPMEAVAGAWRSVGVEVELAPGEGYDAMLEHPERTNQPTAVAEKLVDWLGRAPRRPAVPHAPATAPASRLELPDSAEELLVLTGPRGRLFGVLTIPKRQVDSTCVVLLSAGALRRTGPNRMWVEAARRWSEQGFRTVRIDLGAIGDSDGDEQALRDAGSFYRPEVLDEVRGVLDELQQRGVASRFVLAGLCSGAYAAFQIGATDPRVRAVGMLNTGAFVWAEDLADRRTRRKFRRALTVQGWRDFVRGRVSLRATVQAATTAIALMAPRVSRRGDALAPVARASTAAEGLDRLRASRTPVFLGFSAEEAGIGDLEMDGTRSRMASWPDVTWIDLPGTDHELRPIQAQRAAHDLLDCALAAGVSSSFPPAPLGRVSPSSEDGR